MLAQPGVNMGPTLQCVQYLTLIKVVRSKEELCNLDLLIRHNFVFYNVLYLRVFCFCKSY